MYARVVVVAVVAAGNRAVAVPVAVFAHGPIWNRCLGDDIRAVVGLRCLWRGVWWRRRVEPDIGRGVFDDARHGAAGGEQEQQGQREPAHHRSRYPDTRQIAPGRSDRGPCG